MKNTTAPRKIRSFLNTLKDGFLLILPLAATLAIFQWLWNFVFGFFPDFIGFFPKSWQAFPQFQLLLNLSFLISLVVLTLVSGLIASTFLGRFFYGLFDALLNFSPLIKPVYGGLKKMAGMLFAAPQEDSLESKLTEAVMVPYPSERDRSFGFVTSNNADHFFGPERGKDYLTVYMPSSPIVSSGYYLVFKKADVRPCKKDSAQVMAILLSAGSLQGASEGAARTPDPIKVQKKRPARLRSYFLNGLLLLTPVLGTLSLIVWIFNWLIKYVRTMRVMIPSNLQNLIPESYFGLIANTGIILLLIFIIFLLGLAGEGAIGRALKSSVGGLARKIPVFSTVYEATSAITEIFTQGPGANDFFSKAVLVNFPHKKVYAVGFITHKDSTHLMDGGEDHIPVFLPTSPIPTTGWFMNLRKDELIDIDMPVEKAIALVISVGITAGEKQ